MTSKPVEYCYTLANPRRTRGFGGVNGMYPDVSTPVWSAPFRSVQDAVDDARLVWRDRRGYYPGWGEYVAIAPYVPYEPTFCESIVLDDLCEDAEIAVGSVAYDWVEELDKLPDEDERELYDSLKAVVNDWLKKHDLEPHFGSVDVDKARYYPLWEGATL